MNLTVEQMLAKAIFDLRTIFPYYGTIYQSIEKIPNEDVEILSVHLDKISYCVEALSKCTYGEVVFWILHGVSHIALQHISRKGRRESKLWNLSCDFYVNKLLSEEFGLVGPGDGVLVAGVPIQMPLNVAFRRDLNLKVDSVEYIYKKLQSGISQEKSSKERERENKEKDKEGKEDKEWKSQWDESEKSTHPTCSHSHDFFDLEKGELENSSFVSDFLENQEDFLNKENGGDLIDSLESEIVIKRKIDQLLGEAQLTEIFRREEEKGEGFSCLLQENVENSGESYVDWKKWLRHYLRASTLSDASFSMPDKRFFYQNMILPGAVPEERNELEGMKVCLDTSGSISQEDLNHFMEQIWKISKEFKLNAELIYWDTEIESVSSFQGVGDVKNFHYQGGKGTDVNCLFEYFESKKCKVKPIVSLIFTDGYIRNTYGGSKRKRKYQNTIWVMTKGYDQKFQPSFGKVAVPDFLDF